MTASPAPSHPITIGPLLDRMERSWNETQRLPASKLLRIALMRELSRSLHTLRSELLASGEDGQARDLLRREEFLDQRFMEVQAQSLPFRQVYARSAAGPLENRVPDPAPALPPELARAIGESKLYRADRRWEAFLAAEAFAAGWSFWSFECWIEVERVESWAYELSTRLWPRGLVLFVESGGFHGAKNTEARSALWRGKWHLAISPEVIPPSADGSPEPALNGAFGIDIGALPQVPEEPPERRGPRWLRLL